MLPLAGLPLVDSLSVPTPGKVFCVFGVDGAEEDGGVDVPVDVRACAAPFVLIGVTGAGGAGAEAFSGSSDFFCGGVDGAGVASGAVAAGISTGGEGE